MKSPSREQELQSTLGSSQLSALITKALVQYTNDVNADLDAFVAPRADEFDS